MFRRTGCCLCTLWRGECKSSIDSLVLTQILVEVDVEDNLAITASRNIHSQLDGCHWCDLLNRLCGTVTHGGGMAVVGQNSIAFGVCHCRLGHGWRR